MLGLGNLGPGFVGRNNPLLKYKYASESGHTSGGKLIGTNELYVLKHVFGPDLENLQLGEYLN
jgi:hypothetical protein